MKHVLRAGLILAATTSASLAGSYQCYRYVNGKPTGTHVTVQAASKAEAAAKALAKMRQLGGRVDSVNCH